MGVMQAVQGAIGARQSVQVSDEFRKAIDAKVASGGERGPVDALAQERNPGKPLAGRKETLQAPVRCDKERDPQLGMPIEEPLHAPKRAATQVAPSVEFVPGRCWMDVVDTETHRSAFASGQPPVTFRERHRGHRHAGPA